MALGNLCQLSIPVLSAIPCNVAYGDSVKFTVLQYLGLGLGLAISCLVKIPAINTSL